MKFKSVEEIWSFAEGIAAPMGIEIVDIALNEKQGELTIFIETENGVDLDTCEKFHNAITEPIDELDPSYGDPYTLNVSSPGLDRAIKSDRDFERNLSKEVDVKLFAPLEGKKLFTGSLTGYDETSFTVETADGPRTFERAKAAKVSLHLDF